jgi:DNA-binding winged helix-turn-helix (wHTH) protein/tetratricopeptide (TPR) repeat protein
MGGPRVRGGAADSTGSLRPGGTNPVATTPAVPGRAISFGPFCLDEADGSLWRGAERIDLAPKTFALLHDLATHPNRLLTKTELLARVWPDTHVADGALKARIRELRAVLDDDPDAPRFIETVHRRGYRFIAEVRESLPRPTVEARAGSAAYAPAATPIGREGELAVLRELLERARSGERQIVLVTGEPGIGKTALVDAFVASLPGGIVLGRGQCLEYYGTGEAYLPVLGALGEMARGPHAPALIEQLRRFAPTWLTHLPWLVSSADHGMLERELRGATRERMLREMAEAVEVLASQAPVVMVLEDLHWSDPSTLDLLTLLAHRRQRAPLLVLGTYRPVDVILSGHRLKALKQRLEQQGLCRELRLPYLSREHIALFLGRALDRGELPEDLIDVVVERTGGNPLFLVSLADLVVERRWLAPMPGGVELHAVIARIAEEIPDGLRQMIEQQLERLPPEDARVLEVASVVGEEFTTAAVAAALDASEMGVEQVCEVESRRGQILRPPGMSTRRSDARYGFSHALHRDVLYRRIGRSRRTELHLRIAEWHERTGASPSEIASHFFEAAQGGRGSDKAIAYALRAAERATSRFAFDEAVRHYEMAIALLSSSGDENRERERAEVTVALGCAQARSGAHARATESFLAAAELARARGLDPLFAEAVLQLGRGHHSMVQADERLIGLLEEALERIGPGDSAQRARLLARLDTALSPIAGTHERRAGMAREATEMARRVDDLETWTWVAQYTRWGFVGRGGAAELRAGAEELRVLADRAQNIEQSLYLHLMRIADLDELGFAAESRREIGRFQELARTAGIPWFIWFALRIRTLHALSEGRLGDAEGLVQETFAVGRTMDHPNVVLLVGLHTLMLRHLQGRDAEVEGMLVPFLAREPSSPLRPWLAETHLRQGKETEARRAFEALAADDFAGIARDTAWLIAVAQLSVVCAGLGDRRRAAILYEMLSPFADRVIGVGASLVPLGHGSRYLALLAQTLGRWGEAAELLERSVAAHEEMGARPWLARALLDQARLLERRPRTGRGGTSPRAKADRALDRALELAGEVGMVGLVAEIAALRAAR